MKGSSSCMNFTNAIRPKNFGPIEVMERKSILKETSAKEKPIHLSPSQSILNQYRNAKYTKAAISDIQSSLFMPNIALKKNSHDTRETAYTGNRNVAILSPHVRGKAEKSRNFHVSFNDEVEQRIVVEDIHDKEDDLITFQDQNLVDKRRLRGLHTMPNNGIGSLFRNPMTANGGTIMTISPLPSTTLHPCESKPVCCNGTDLSQRTSSFEKILRWFS